MTEMPRFRFADLLVLLIVLTIAAGCRVWYVSQCVGGDGTAPLRAQTASPSLKGADLALLGHKNPTEQDKLIVNIKREQWFGSSAPLADKEEQTAHIAPGYPWLVGLLARWVDDPEMVLRWIQCGLGTLTAAFYYFFARRAFRSRLVAALAGLLCAIHPFWIINTAEMDDGVLAAAAVGAALVLGTRGSQEGGAFTSLLYGLLLAGVALVRAALLPFAIVGLLWFLLRCRVLQRGWLFALLAFLGFVNGLAPWAVRNYQAFHEPIPIVDSAFVHLWIGNNDRATGGSQDEETLRSALPPTRLKELLAEPNQAARYRMLAPDVWEVVQSDPAGTVRRRLWATLSFFLGESWFTDQTGARMRTAPTGPAGEGPKMPSLPEWLENCYLGIIQAALLAMLLLGLLGWRWTYAWRREARLATLAAIWIPLPYIIGHAGALWGPRLPLDGVLLCYVAFALGCFLPTVGGSVLRNNPQE